ncbi:GTP cyclohydrolase I FolE2, partial [bacterium]|nr:GTP cyclohydrolase I FolE2 [bacterium]
VYKLFGYADVVTITKEETIRLGIIETIKQRMMVGVELMGSTCCPCSMEMCKGGVAHNQRAKLKVMIETDGSRSAESLVLSLMNAFSAPVKTLLKRPDEKALVEYMHSRPFFVEDIVRNAVEILGIISHEGWCKIEATSYESIHPHNVYAMYEGELK